MWQNSQTQTQLLTKPKTFKLWQNPKTQILTKLNNLNFDKTQNSNCNKTQKVKVTELNSKCDSCTNDSSGNSSYSDIC